MADSQESGKKKFEPKAPVNLDPPKDDPITVEELAKRDGTDPSLPTYVAIKGTVFDVSSSASYKPETGSYRVFAGKDASRALGMSSTKPEDVSDKWEDLTDEQKKVLDDWFTFFSKRYNIVGRVVA